MTPTHVDLFSGIGGFSLAAQWAGFKTVLHCEIDPFCQKVLRKRFADVPIHDDIKTLTGERVGAVDLLTGGFPCQPFSIAGKRKGAADERHLWPEMLRVLTECRPTWVVGENVRGLVSSGQLDTVLDELGDAGYETWAFVFPAAAAGAPHQRYRTFVVAHTALHGQPRSGAARTGRDGFADSGAVADADEPGLQGYGRLDSERGGAGEWAAWSGSRPLQGIWESEPAVGRVADGVSARTHRLRSLGNAVVPQQVYPILAAIYETMRQAA